MDIKQKMKERFKEWADKKSLGVKQVPKALEILKQQFLYAIGKAGRIPTEEEEEFVKKCNDNLHPLDMSWNPMKPPSEQWSDAFAHEAVAKMLAKYQNFEINLYLNCVKAVYLQYSGTNVSGVYEALAYVITHARLFGDQSQNMFQFERNANDSKTVQVFLGAITDPLPDTKYMRQVTKLIEDLETNYVENKYRMLNGNVTYLALLLLRRFVKGSSQFFNAFNRINTHDDYVKLCPHPLDKELPKIDKSFNANLIERSLQPLAYLAINAYLTVQDERSKRILRLTCLQYIEWTGLQMPDLFFKVAKLYKLEEAELWDNLCFDVTYDSLFNLSKDYYKLHEKTKLDPPASVAWFPYCRALNGCFHKDLSAGQNTVICMLLVYMIDLKIGFETSHVRDSLWTKKCHLGQKKTALSIAETFYKKFSK